MKDVLLVWNEVPENLKMFELLDLTKEEYNKIILCHGLYINSSEMDGEQERAMDWLNEYLVGKEPFYDEVRGFRDLKYLWDDMTVIVSGFLL
jgi:predicted AAA+ superfamily ATPase